MNIKIMQVDVGSGTQWGGELAPRVIREICIPSVQAYAAKHDYEYQLITESSYSTAIGPLDFLATEKKHYAFERYLNLKTEADAIVYLDNDIYVSKLAQQLPDISGILAVYEPGYTNSRRIFVSENGLDVNREYANSGMIMADRDSAGHLSEYMVDRARRRDRAKGKNTDNMMFNEYILANQERFRALPEQWNYMPMLAGSSLGLRSNFMHLVGTAGKKLLDQLVTTGRPIDELLEAIASGLLHLKIN